VKPGYTELVAALCAPDSLRCTVLARTLESGGLAVIPVTLENQTHLYLPGTGTANGSRQIFTAHWDRYPGSPGANDNAAAAAGLALYALKCRERGRGAPGGFLFTDGEELREGEPLNRQGAFRLGRLLAEKGLEGAVFTVFDMCGIGDTPVVSFSGPWETPELRSARDKLRALLRTRSAGLLCEIPFLPSDTLGFNLAGHPTLLVSLLPWGEAKEFLAAGGRGIPGAWKTAHTPADIPARLEERSTRLMQTLLPEIAALF
jgi:hypothetical protein